MRTSLGLGLLGLIALVATGDAANANDTIKCPVLKNGTGIPYGAKASTCLTSNTKEITASTWTRVLLYKTEESWQKDPRGGKFADAIEEAVDRGLGLFGSHAGTRDHPLVIHVTVMDGYGWVAPLNQEQDMDAMFASFSAPGAGDGAESHCHLLVPFPTPIEETEPCQ